VPVNGFVQIPLSCVDPRDPPSFPPKDPLPPEILAQPPNGNLGQLQDDNSVIYTPNKDFSGTDSFAFKANDGLSDSNIATINVNVVRPAAGATGGPAGTGVDVTAASIGTVRVSPATWRGGPRLPSFSFAAARVGTRISFRLSEAARVTLTLARPLPGRRVGRRCVKPSPRNRGKRRCTRYPTAGRLRFNGRAGTNRVRFQGRLSRRKRLRIGRYRLRVGATDAAGNISRARTANFRIVAR
jgi:Bacterial Ig domain